MHGSGLISEGAGRWALATARAADSSTIDARLLDRTEDDEAHRANAPNTQMPSKTLVQPPQGHPRESFPRHRRVPERVWARSARGELTP
jgi:hypothetical protein